VQAFAKHLVSAVCKEIDQMNIAKLLMAPAGLVPWAADLVFRFAQGASITTITSATISDDERIITWELQLEDVRCRVAL
jgi:hypothetical protein